MKKILFLALLISSFAFATQEPKKVIISFTHEEIQTVYDALGELPAKKVEVLRSRIYFEATKQLTDTVKKK